jgi:glycosyltransferase involved in cell wall biosynthesis
MLDSAESIVPERYRLGNWRRVIENQGTTLQADAKDLPDISVVICTYNRCQMLPGALESVLAQQTGGVRYEVIVVDNNSTDQTRQVIESYIWRGATNLHYVFEGRQGKPYALNKAIDCARAPILAFTDDDIRVAPDWVAKIKRAFDEHAEVDLVGGKVLPIWDGPPAWLTREHWSPLALVDYGDAPFYTSAHRPTCLVGANLSMRRETFDLIGRFSTSLLRCQDHELQLRLWRAGRQGLYLPDVIVMAKVQPERLTKAYHRWWHSNHGKYSAIMGYSEMLSDDLVDDEGRIKEPAPDEAMLYGQPGFVYRECIRIVAGSILGWVTASIRGCEELSFRDENRIRHSINFINKSRQLYAARLDHSHPAELGRFFKAILRKKLKLNMQARRNRRHGEHLAIHDQSEGN